MEEERLLYRAGMSKQVYVVKYGCCAEALFTDSVAAERYRKLLIVPGTQEEQPSWEPMDLDPDIPTFDPLSNGYVVEMTRDGKYQSTHPDSLLITYQWRNRVTLLAGQPDFIDQEDMLVLRDTLYVHVIAQTSRLALERTDEYRLKLIAAGCWPEVLEEDVTTIDDASNILRDEPEIA